ncbi:hypothetical protein WQQ_13490 [Hydrocarboniphaga effusa AP103]|uniref:Uncharacterized protein n=1 Tax=Hydrocarboniphaga effusa AP103 TaxID=1172194 RepID=I7ZHJ4_9GAMM|nr:hypothetical protein WQQ_13490 [Hydrocarboniphaga effusa AP103]
MAQLLLRGRAPDEPPRSREAAKHEEMSCESDRFRRQSPARRPARCRCCPLLRLGHRRRSHFRARVVMCHH